MNRRTLASIALAAACVVGLTACDIHSPDMELGFTANPDGTTTVTGLAADQCGQLIMEALHWQQFEGFGQLFSDRNAMQAAEDWAPLDAYRLRFKIRMPRNQGEKTAQPTITENTGSITLACSTSGAQIYYTTDQSYPGRSNPAAKLYEAPFTATAGDVINAAAYASGYTPSHMIQATVT